MISQSRYDAGVGLNLKVLLILVKVNSQLFSMVFRMMHYFSFLHFAVINTDACDNCCFIRCSLTVPDDEGQWVENRSCQIRVESSFTAVKRRRGLSCLGDLELHPTILLDHDLTKHFS